MASACPTVRSRGPAWRMLAWVVLSLLAVGAAAAVVAARLPWISSLRAAHDTKPKEHPSSPIRVPPLVQGLLPISRMDLAWLDQAVPVPDEKAITPSLCLHRLHLDGPEAKLRPNDAASAPPVLKMFMEDASGKAAFGRSILLRTRTGIRFRDGDGRAAEQHRDQCLAVFAESGVSPRRPILVDGSAFAVGDLLAESVANFHWQQEELAFTALAYAIYLPPAREWQNRYGERFNFDELANQLIDRPLSGSCCAGVHVLAALTVLARVDQQIPVLSGSTRDRLWAWLQQCVDTALSNQKPDGSWRADWSRDLLPEGACTDRSSEDSDASCLLATSHLTEWMTTLPERLQVPQATLQRSGRWLFDRLRKMTPEERWRQFCPCTHAICGLRRLAIPADAVVEAPVQGFE